MYKLTAKVIEYNKQTHDALQLIWDATNTGQRNKMLKNEQIKELLDRYGIVYEQT